MADFGSSRNYEVNATQYKVKITYSSVQSEFLLLQDARKSISHTEYREPTTSAGPVYYSGQPNDRLQGTILYSTDAWTNASNNLKILTTRTNGELPVFKCVVTQTDIQGSPATNTYTWDPASGNSGGKIESLVITKAPEGGVKIDISIVLIGDPAIT